MKLIDTLAYGCKAVEDITMSMHIIIIESVRNFIVFIFKNKKSLCSCKGFLSDFVIKDLDKQKALRINPHHHHGHVHQSFYHGSINSCRQISLFIFDKSKQKQYYF